MSDAEEIYRRLQKHLDSQAVGFPATGAGAEIRLLKHIFTPEEADIAACLSYKPEPLETVAARVGPRAASPEALERILTRIQRKGGLESSIKDGQRRYCNAPLVVGMYEMQVGRLTPEFVRDFNAYTAERSFGVAFLGTALPQMRTIPVARSIRPQQRVSTFDEVAVLLQKADAPFVILECICRKKHALEGGTCQVTDRTETCLGMGSIAQSVLHSGNGREITRDEALLILEKNQHEGLVLQPSNTVKAEFICSCCGCCCGMLRLHRALPKPLDFWASNFQAVVDGQACEGCGLCARRCQVGAVTVAGPKATALVNLDLCIGCGVCVPGCPPQAIGLVRKSVEATPPQTREALYDILIAGKKGRWAKLKLNVKLMLDALRTGRTALLKG